MKTALICFLLLPILHASDISQAPLSGLPTTVVYTSKIAGIHADGSATTNVGTDDRATLQAVLNTATASSPLELVVDKGFIVIDSTNQSLIWNSYTKISCNPGAGFSWKGSANLHQKPMIVNANQLGIATPIDTAMWMDGCTVNGNHDTGHGGAGQALPNAMNSDGIFISPMQLVGVTNLWITNHKSFKSAGFGIWIANATQFKLDNIRVEHSTGEFATDGIHINGPASNFSIKNVSGFAGDDMIALNADDGHLANAAAGLAGAFGNNALASTIKNGPISGCLVEGVHLENSYDLFRLLSAQSALSCTLRHLDGVATSLLYIIDNDPQDFAGQQGWLGNFGTVIVEDESASFSLPGCAVQLDAIYDSLSLQITNRTQPSNPILCTSNRTQMQDLRLDLKIFNITVGSAEVLRINGGSINSATITGTVDFSSSGQAAQPIVNAIAGQVTTLKFLNFEADYVNTLVVVNGTLINSIQFTGGRHKHAGGNPTLFIGANGSVLNAGSADFFTALFSGGPGPVPVFLTGISTDVVPDPSPIFTGSTAFWRLSEATGATRVDSAGFLRNMSDVGSVPQVACGNGQAGNCANFQNNALKFLTTAGGPFTVTSSGYTITGWVNFTALAAAIQIIVAKLNEVNVIYNNTNGNVGVCIVGTCVYSPVAVTTATWYFVVAGWDPATSQPFISINNAADTLGGGQTPAVNNGNPFTFGIQSGSLPLNAKLGLWGVWARKLTASERTILYNAGTFYDPTSISSAGTSNTIITGSTYRTLTNCSSSASPAVCGSAAAGSVSIGATLTTVTVNTTAVTANSQIFLMYDASLGTKLGVTCNTTEPALFGVTGRAAGVSFQITATAPITNPACFSYFIIN